MIDRTAFLMATLAALLFLTACAMCVESCVRWDAAVVEVSP